MTKEEVCAFLSHLLNGILDAQVLFLQLGETTNSNPGESGNSKAIYVDDTILLGDRVDSGVIAKVRLNRGAVKPKD